MPDFEFGTVLSVVKLVLQAVDGSNSKPPQVNGCGCGCGCGSGFGSSCGCGCGSSCGSGCGCGSQNCGCGSQNCGCGCGSQNCGTTPDYVPRGLQFAIDKLSLKPVFQSGDLNANQVELLLSLFKDLDGYLHQFITMLTSIKQILPVNGAPDTNNQKRRQMVRELGRGIRDWSLRRQKGVSDVYNSSGVGTEPDPTPTPKY